MKQLDKDNKTLKKPKIWTFKNFFRFFKNLKKLKQTLTISCSHYYAIYSTGFVSTLN